MKKINSNFKEFHMPTSTLKWGSEITKKGWDGLNDAAINAFNSNVINSFVREMFQNSNDARDKLLINQQTGKRLPLHISINYKTFKQEQFPNFEEFIDIFRRIKCAEANEQHVEFFKHGEKAMGKREAIKFFIYEDFNTTGLSGDDNDPTSTFSSCVLSEGTSVKPDDTAGGSYGIGKNAIFAFSKLRTVFYSSLNNKGESIFQGVSKLASFTDVEGNTHRGRIFCGHGNELKSVRNFEELPEIYQEVFRRNRPGLSQYAACPLDNADWLEQFTKAILRNYWLLLYTESLIVELKDQDNLVLKIENSNLEELLLKYYDPENYTPDDNVEPGGNPYEFYKCIVENTFKEMDIDKLGKVKFFYRELSHSTTNRVAYMRNNMVVYSSSIWGFGSINYCGVFICENREGNVILRMMEPPTHDSFDPERLSDKTNKYSPVDGRNILWHIKQLINAALQEISEKYKKAAEDIPWLDELLSSLTGASGSGNRINIESDKETPERMGVMMKTTVAFNSLSRNTMVYDPTGFVPGTGVKPIKPGPPRPQPPKPPKPGPKPGPTPTPNTKIGSRVFKTTLKRKINGVDSYAYKMFLTSESLTGTTDVLISQKGDSGNVVCFEILEVTDINESRLKFSKVDNTNGDTIAYKLKSVPIPSQLLIYLSEPYKSSIKIVKS